MANPNWTNSIQRMGADLVLSKRAVSGGWIATIIGAL